MVQTASLRTWLNALLLFDKMLIVNAVSKINLVLEKKSFLLLFN